METLRMNGKERKRLEVLSRVTRAEVSLSKAAELLELSYRQAKRVYRRYRLEKDAGLVHGLRGRRSNRCRDSKQREEVLVLYRERYSDFGPTLAAEYLAKEDQQQVTMSTLRRWLMSAGLWRVRKQGSKHRRWRPRKAHVGEMVQMDGSHHDWFEGRREWAVLMVMIDDATNRTYAQFFAGETTVAAMTTFRAYVQQYGLPRSLYVDRDSIYETTRDATADEELRETEALTQFGRAMNELEVKLILAHSPQAKGRVERRNGVLQDRLVKALRWAGIRDLATANGFLEEQFLPELNGKFRVEPKWSADLHRRVPKNIQLDRVLSFQESRVVQNDWTISWCNRWFQLTEANQKLALARQRILVCEQLDGTIGLWYRGRELPCVELPEQPPRGSAKKPATGPPESPVAAGYKPASDHPWRRAILTPRQPAARPPRPPCSASVATLPALRKAGGAGGEKKVQT
jgi:transposase